MKTTASLLLILSTCLAASCDHGSPTAPASRGVLGSWQATQTVTVPGCSLQIVQTLPVELNQQEAGGQLSARVAYPDIGSCVLLGTLSGPAIDLADYRCMPFGYSCPGQAVTCGDLVVMMCRTALWTSVHAALEGDSGSGVAAVRVPVVDPATGGLRSELTGQANVVFRRTR